MDKEIMKGSVDILILSIILQKDTYGYEIIKNLKNASQDLYNMSEGTLYPALKRLENKNWIQSYWGDLESGGRRKYYKIKEDGKKELNKKIEEWNKVDKLIKTSTEGISWTEILKPMSKRYCVN